MFVRGGGVRGREADCFVGWKCRWSGDCCFEED